MSMHFLGVHCPICRLELRTCGLRVDPLKVQRDGIDAFTLVMACSECGHRTALFQALGRRDYFLCIGYLTEMAA